MRPTRSASPTPVSTGPLHATAALARTDQSTGHAVGRSIDHRRRVKESSQMVALSREDLDRPPRSSADRPLRIGIIAPPWFSVPPSGYGGIEAMVAGLADGLVARGHHVTLIASGEGRTAAQRFHAVFSDPPSTRLGEPMPEVLHAAVAAALIEREELDVVHDHTLVGPLLARGRGVPTVVTAHGPVRGEPGDYLVALGSSVDVVAISWAQRQLRPEVNWLSTVHNGVDVGSFPLGRGDGGYLLFLGRFNAEKGAHLAIDVARSAGRRLLLAGKLNEPAEKVYFADAVAPRLGRGVEYVGEADAATKRQLLAGAEALLFPVCWDEPFGLVMVEAMACGTPVVALRRGSVPEIVTHGETGFVVDEPAQLVEAARAVGTLDRGRCRARAELFDTSRMVEGYEASYRAVVEGRELCVAARPDDPMLVSASA
jgi:glycosyltransferase involved in cell wall biosynthesis